MAAMEIRRRMNEKKWGIENRGDSGKTMVHSGDKEVIIESERHGYLSFEEYNRRYRAMGRETWNNKTLKERKEIGRELG